MQAPPTPSHPPVEGLKDIALPAPVGLFPLAPGWYVVAALLLALLVWAVYAYRRRRAANLYRREAMAELDDIVASLERKGGRHELAARLPALLKRVALHVEPRAAVAGLTDDAWLVQLDRMYGGEAFTKGPGRLLPRLAYGTVAFVSKLQRAEIDALVRLSREWIARHRSVA